MEFDVENAGGAVVPGSFVHIEMDVPSPSRPQVPSEALVVRQEKAFVPVLGADSTIRFRAVTIAVNDGRVVRVLKGLASGERVVLNGHPERRLPNTLNVNFVGCVGVDLLKAVPEVAASTGSACHEGEQQRQFTLSPVLTAMGVPVSLGKGAVRLSVGRFTTEEEIDRAAAALVAAAMV